MAIRQFVKTFRINIKFDYKKNDIANTKSINIQKKLAFLYIIKKFNTSPKIK